jgi:hypothetical protein
VEKCHLLILGAPRSGTTLLAAMISRHTEIAVLNEDRGWAMLKLLGKAIVGNKRCIPNQIEMNRRNLFAIRLWKRIGLAREYPTSQFSIAEYLTLPHIRVIALIRNGNDVISSGMRRGNKSFRGASYRWCRAIQIIHELKAKHPEQVLVVSFEDLVLYPRENMQRVALFLEVEYQERMLEGPVHNPRYPENGMNKEKVNRSKKEQIDFNIAERFPAAERQYLDLLRLCDRAAVAELRRVRHG